MKITFFPALSLTLTLLAGRTHGQQCKTQHTTCLDCVSDAACGSWYNVGGGGSCYNRCIIADAPCYKTRPTSTSSDTPAKVCDRADADKANTALCTAKKDCASCTATSLTDGNGNCAWFPGRGWCDKPGCNMKECGDTDSTKCPAPTEVEVEVEVVNEGCESKGDCLGCLSDPACGSWYPGNGCHNRCLIADISCYRPNPDKTPEQVCKKADTDMANKKLCSAKSDCGSCTSTPLSDGSGNCAWFSKMANNQFCGPPGCTMIGCGDTDPANCPAKGDFKLISLNEDDGFCVGIAGGTPMPGKILKLVECDENDDSMLWNMDGRGRFRTKGQYNGMSLW